MRISDWSSDVCSSDLATAHRPVEFRIDAAIERQIDVEAADLNAVLNDTVQPFEIFEKIESAADVGQPDEHAAFVIDGNGFVTDANAAHNFVGQFRFNMFGEAANDGPIIAYLKGNENFGRKHFRLTQTLNAGQSRQIGKASWWEE